MEEVTKPSIPKSWWRSRPSPGATPLLPAGRVVLDAFAGALDRRGPGAEPAHGEGREVMRLIALGHTYKEAAQRLTSLSDDGEARLACASCS